MKCHQLEQCRRNSLEEINRESRNGQEHKKFIYFRVVIADLGGEEGLYNLCD